MTYFNISFISAKVSYFFCNLKKYRSKITKSSCDVRDYFIVVLPVRSKIEIPKVAPTLQTVSTDKC